VAPLAVFDEALVVGVPEVGLTLLDEDMLVRF
jgi:hypothetical protein